VSYIWIHILFSLIIVTINVWNSRIHLDRLQNKYTNYKGIKYNTNFGQITGYNM